MNITRVEQLTNIQVELCHLRQEMYDTHVSLEALIENGTFDEKLAALERAFRIAERLRFLMRASDAVCSGISDEFT